MPSKKTISLIKKKLSAAFLHTPSKGIIVFCIGTLHGSVNCIVTVQITIFRVMQLDTILQNALFEEERACDGKISRNGILINREKSHRDKEIKLPLWLACPLPVCCLLHVYQDSNRLPPQGSYAPVQRCCLYGPGKVMWADLTIWTMLDEFSIVLSHMIVISESQLCHINLWL